MIRKTLVVAAIMFMAAAPTYAQTVTSYSRTPSTFSITPQDFEIDATLSGLDTSQWARVVISGPGGVYPANTGCIDVASTTQSFNDNIFYTDGAQFVGTYSLPRIFFFSNSTCTTHAGTVNLNPYLGNAVTGPVEMIMSAPYSEGGGTTVTVEDSLYDNIFKNILLWLALVGVIAFVTYKLAK